MASESMSISSQLREVSGDIPWGCVFPEDGGIGLGGGEGERGGEVEGTTGAAAIFPEDDLSRESELGATSTTADSDRPRSLTPLASRRHAIYGIDAFHHLENENELHDITNATTTDNTTDEEEEEEKAGFHCLNRYTPFPVCEDSEEEREREEREEEEGEPFSPVSCWEDDSDLEEEGNGIVDPEMDFSCLDELDDEKLLYFPLEAFAEVCWADAVSDPDPPVEEVKNDDDVRRRSGEWPWEEEGSSGARTRVGSPFSFGTGWTESGGGAVTKGFGSLTLDVKAPLDQPHVHSSRVSFLFFDRSYTASPSQLQLASSDPSLSVHGFPTTPRKQQGKQGRQGKEGRQGAMERLRGVAGRIGRVGSGKGRSWWVP